MIAWMSCLPHFIVDLIACESVYTRRLSVMAFLDSKRIGEMPMPEEEVQACQLQVPTSSVDSISAANPLHSKHIPDGTTSSLLGERKAIDPSQDHPGVIPLHPVMSCLTTTYPQH